MLSGHHTRAHTTGHESLAANTVFSSTIPTVTAQKKSSQFCISPSSAHGPVWIAVLKVRKTMRNQRIRAPTDAEANGSAPKGRLRSLPLSSAPAEKGFAQCCQTRNAKAQKTVSPYRERRHFHFIAICSFCTLQRPLEHNIGSGSKATNVKREKKKKNGRGKK